MGGGMVIEGWAARNGLTVTLGDYLSQFSNASGEVFKRMCQHGTCCDHGEILVAMETCAPAVAMQRCGDGSPVTFRVVGSTVDAVLTERFQIEYERLARAYKTINRVSVPL